MVKQITYHSQTHQEENTPLVTILETSVEKKQSTAIDSRQSPFVIDLAKSSFGAIYYPIPGSQWYVKKISGVWTLMSRAAQQNPQLDPTLTPVPGDTYIGSEGTTYVVGDLNVAGGFTVGGGTDPDIGAIRMHPTATPPTGWLICNGSAISRTTYATLFGIIGTTYGVGNGTTTFNIPDIKGKVPVGFNSAETEFDVLGETGGAKTVTLLTANLPTHLHAVGTLVNGNNSGDHTHSGTSLANSGITANHTHTVPNVISTSGSGSGAFFESWPGGSGSRTHTTSTVSSDHAHNISGSTGGISAAHNHTITGSTANTGSDTAHNNLQPYIALNFIIKALTSFVPPAAGTGLTEDGFHAIGTSASSEGHTAKVVDDVFKRFIILDDGTAQWGSGALAVDTNLYRSAADTLKTDDSFVVGGTVAVTGAGTIGGALVVTGDVTGAKGRFGGTSGDAVFIGNDSKLVDVNTADAMGIQGQSNAANGVLVFGSGLDTNLYRGAANQLKTDDTFVAANVVAGDSAWITPTLLNSWANYDAAWESAQYRKLSSGMVVIKGMIKNGATTTTIFTLPVGYRPSLLMLFSCMSIDVVCRIDVNTNGNVSWASGGSNSWVNINLTFWPDA